MSRFRPLEQVQQKTVTSVTSTQSGFGYAGISDKALINKDSCSSVTTVTDVTIKKIESSGVTGGGVGVATGDIFRARLQQAAHDLPVDMAVLIAEFAHDRADITEGKFDDVTLRKAIYSFVVYRLGISLAAASSPADDGVVQCRQCSYWWNRCRHPDKYRGRWPELSPDRWRRCAEYKQRLEY